MAHLELLLEEWSRRREPALADLRTLLDRLRADVGCGQVYCASNLLENLASDFLLDRSALEHHIRTYIERMHASDPAVPPSRWLPAPSEPVARASDLPAETVVLIRVVADARDLSDRLLDRVRVGTLEETASDESFPSSPVPGEASSMPIPEDRRHDMLLGAPGGIVWSAIASLSHRLVTESADGREVLHALGVHPRQARGHVARLVYRAQHPLHVPCFFDARNTCFAPSAAGETTAGRTRALSGDPARMAREVVHTNHDLSTLVGDEVHIIPLKPHGAGADDSGTS